MSADILFPGYIPRGEERQILQEAAQVQKDRKSRAVLLYGPGGVGKTSLVRELAGAGVADTTTIWLDPIDLDDSEYWLLSNLERKVANRIDPENWYFGPYLEYLSRLPSYTLPRIGHESVVSHLGRIKRVFVECYNSFVQGSGKTVVMVFDTVEAIRSTYVFLTLTQWMKALPATLFILSGRPLPGYVDGQDPIKNELDDPYQPIPVTTVQLGEFTEQTALDYVNSSRVASGLTPDEKAKLVRLTRGHPLWLAFAISYLKEKGIPEEAEVSLTRIERNVPYRGDMTPEGYSLHEEFKRRLLTPYREVDFWHEAVKRLAVVRQSVNRPIWQRLMADRPLPEGVGSLDEAWEMLLRIPWIRPRANRRFVTLHDGVAEEMAQRVIPLHDQGQQWRRQLWQRAMRIYSEEAAGLEAELSTRLPALDQRLQLFDERVRLQDKYRPATEEESGFVKEVGRLDAQKRELDQFRAAHLYYQLLCDFAAGCRQFLGLFGRAKLEQNFLLQDLLALEMQRFLPGGTYRYALSDVVGNVIDEFREWLSYASPGLYLQVGLSLADYFIENEQPETAIALLDMLPVISADYGQRYRLGILRGNAYTRIPGRVREGLPWFQQALAEATALRSADRQKLIAEAYKELGFYYRNEGLWRQADDAYRQARNAISATLSERSSDEDHEEMASIQTNWAYVKGLCGSYRDGSNLVESAITVRHRLNQHQQEGMSWSVCGEVYRYERRFQKAWDAYSVAERIFHEQRNWPWLGVIYQEQAICLFQAMQDGVNLEPGKNPIEQAKTLITLALDVCRDQSIRAYPSALNRAGRIFGQADFDAGLRFLADGIDWARRLSDGWFCSANLIEYVELSYRAWARTGRREYRDQIADSEGAITQAMREYDFPALQGRWNLLQGHLGIHDWLETGDVSRLSAALENYKQGFALIAEGNMGSSGASAIPGEFKTLGELFWKLSSEVREEWQKEFRRTWSGLESGSTLLLARLEQLY